MFVLALSLYNTWNRGVFLLCKITNLLIYSNIYIDSFKFGGIEKNLVSILNALDREKYSINMIFLNNAIGDMFYQVEIPLNTILLNQNELSWKNLVIFSNFIKFLPKRIFRKLYRIPDAIDACINNSDGFFAFDLCHIKMYDYWNAFKTGFDKYLESIEE